MILRAIGAITVIIVALALVQRLFGGPTWDDIGETCIDEGMSGIQCACIVQELEDAGYEPEDVAGENFDERATAVALPCVL